VRLLARRHRPCCGLLASTTHSTTARAYECAVHCHARECVVRLLLCPQDVDDLDDITMLEQYVERSDIVLVVLTASYLSSRNCRRELSAAVEMGKPIVLLVETDDGKGATTVARLRAEFEEVGRLGSHPT
jgi:hypothetical protein